MSETLSRLRRAVSDSRAGRSSTILVTGGIGVGKSWLLGRFIDELPDDIRLLRATGHPAESDLPFAGLHQLVSPLLPRLGELPALQAAALGTALALLPGEPGDRLAASAGLLGLITLEAETRPVVIVIDDLHCMDTSTRQALTFVARRMEADEVFMLLAGRPEPVGERGEIAGAGVERIELGLLDEPASRALLGSRFPDLGAEATGRVLAQAGGLPLALLQIPADLSPEQRSGAAPLPDPLPLGSALDEFYSSRIRELGDDGRRAVAVAGLDELGLGQLAAALAALGLSVEHLEAAETAGLLRVSGEGYRFAHPTVRTAVLRAATSAELRRARSAIIDALPPGSPRVAAHLDALATGPDSRTADALDAAAADAWGRAAYEEAGRAWESSARRTADAGPRAARYGRAVESYLRSGAWARLGPLLAALVGAAKGDAEEAQWQSLALIAGLFSDAGLPPRERIERLSTRLLPAYPDGAARLLTTYAFVLLLSGNFREASSVVDGLRDLLPGHPFALADALVHDDIDLLIGRPGAGRLLVSDWAERMSDEQLCDPSSPVSPIVIHMVWIGAVDVAERIIERQYEALQARGGVSLLDICIAQRGGVLQARGRWDEANAAFSSAAELARAADFAGPLPHIELRHAYLLAARGQEEQVRQILERVGRLRVSSQPLHRHLTLCVEGLLELSLGRAERAAELLSSAGGIEQEEGMVEPSFYSRSGDLFDALWRLRRGEEALAELAQLEHRANVTGRTSALAVAGRGRGLAAPAGQVDETFGAALELHRGAPDPFETARTELAWGQRLRRDRRKADARVPLHRALAEFETLGAAPWARIALAELAACGERRASSDASGAAGKLTPRELEVALAVARGASNAEAAARLFISKKTVEYHLAGVFRKLGANGRAELAAALGL